MWGCIFVFSGGLGGSFSNCWTRRVALGPLSLRGMLVRLKKRLFCRARMACTFGPKVFATTSLHIFAATSFHPCQIIFPSALVIRFCVAGTFPGKGLYALAPASRISSTTTVDGLGSWETSCLPSLDNRVPLFSLVSCKIAFVYGSSHSTSVSCLIGLVGSCCCSCYKLVFGSNLKQTK